MKQIVRYRFMTMPNKLYADVRITIDEESRAEVRSIYDGGRSTNIVLLPIVNIQILQPATIDENGRRYRPLPSMNDSVGLTKFNIPTFLNELKAIYDGMKTPSLYSYVGKRLELDNKEAEKIRRAFQIGRSAVEFSAVVIEEPSDTGEPEYLEGIKMKFNNESSSVLLTLREIEYMIWILDNVDIDNLVLTMYLNFIDRHAYEKSKPIVDIKPTAQHVQNVSEPPKKKDEPIRQETVINVPAEKYINFDDVDKEDFAKYMNPPIESQQS